MAGEHDTQIPTSTRWPCGSPGAGISVRLLLAQTMVLVAGAATTWLVAAVVGPPLFEDHLRRAAMASMSHEQFHTELAYRSATAISVGWPWRFPR